MIGCMPRPALSFRDEAGGVRLLGSGAGQGEIPLTRRFEVLIRVAAAVGEGELASGISELDLCFGCPGLSGRARTGTPMCHTEFQLLAHRLDQIGEELTPFVIERHERLARKLSAADPVGITS